MTKACPYCHRPMPKPTRDHIIPRSRMDRGNLIGAKNSIKVCAECNRTKGHYLPLDPAWYDCPKRVGLTKTVMAVMSKRGLVDRTDIIKHIDSPNGLSAIRAQMTKVNAWEPARQPQRATVVKFNRQTRVAAKPKAPVKVAGGSLHSAFSLEAQRKRRAVAKKRRGARRVAAPVTRHALASSWGFAGDKWGGK